MRAMDTTKSRGTALRSGGENADGDDAANTLVSLFDSSSGVSNASPLVHGGLQV